ncbi:cell division protein FtsQ/DivIB [Microbulbifer sp. GL-2]|uniref:cell division protein FtsQ/DivIB n=1 Tax=Microbulbifer sp. GL-2 TaxID=2591606 RepID=UPI001162440B|nr:FtsQ-type POTRA domain-containing protein [Microbulbifer sp. GL-2]BBM02332.1 cell division protein FtsQ [Microbulbifer sp. GL-2]
MDEGSAGTINWRPWLLFLLMVSLAVGLLGGGYWLWQRLPAIQLSKMDALEQVEVRGPFNAVAEEQLKEILLPYLQEGFFSADIRAMRTAMMGNPWISTVTINRRWPRGVVVEVTEVQPLAVWGKDRLLVASGALLPRPAHMRVGALPELAGDVELVEQIMSQYQALAGLLTTRDMEVKRLSFDDLSGWHLELVSGIELKLGHDALLERVNRFLFLSRGLLAPHLDKIAGVDTRYGNAVAVQWKNEQE